MKQSIFTCMTLILSLASAVPVPQSLSNRYLPSINGGFPLAADAIYTERGTNNGVDEDHLAEPASYRYRYEVVDRPTDLEFGHQEQREADEIQGEYHVLHPDGRKMVVKYTVDRDGYKPTITFERAREGFPRQQVYNARVAPGFGSPPSVNIPARDPRLGTNLRPPY